MLGEYAEIWNTRSNSAKPLWSVDSKHKSALFVLIGTDATNKECIERETTISNLKSHVFMFKHTEMEATYVLNFETMLNETTSPYTCTFWILKCAFQTNKTTSGFKT